MANQKISQLNTIGAIDSANDYLAIVDSSEAETMKVAPDALKASMIPALTSTYIAFGSASNLLTESNRITWDNTNQILKTGGQASKGTSYGVQLLPYSGAEPVVFGDGSGYTGMWMATASPSTTNFVMLYNGTTLQMRGSSNIQLRASSSLIIDVNPHYVDFTPGSTPVGSQTVFNFRTPANTGQTASTETIGFYVDMATNTIQHATGALATQRDFLISARTHRFVAASTITDAGTLVITGSPVAGTNATITNSYALWTQSGKVRMQGLPTSSAGLQAGDLWNNSGVLNIV